MKKKPVLQKASKVLLFSYKVTCHWVVWWGKGLFFLLCSLLKFGQAGQLGDVVKLSTVAFLRIGCYGRGGVASRLAAVKSYSNFGAEHVYSAFVLILLIT